MGNPKAFLTIPRQEAGYRPVHDRISDYGEVEQTLNTSERKLQASRCMDCGVPFCHWACPLGNRPPEFQDALYRGRWDEAYRLLTSFDSFHFIQALSYSSGYFFFYGHWHQFKITDT